MKNKIIAYSKLKFSSMKDGWNHPALSTTYLTISMSFDYFESSISKRGISQDMHDKYLSLYSLMFSQVGEVQESIKDITELFTVLNSVNDASYYLCQDFRRWTFFNHFAIIQLDVLVRRAIKSKISVEDEVVDLLGKLVEQANNSSAECFQVSVHYACKFFAEWYPDRSEEIQSILVSEKLQKPIIEKYPSRGYRFLHHLFLRLKGII